MAEVLVLLFMAALICFGYVIIFGAPYLPTLKSQQKNALDLLNLKKGDTLLELGCGDGRVVLAAAKQGIKVIGYEINPILFFIAKIRTWRYRNLVNIRIRNYWRIKLPPTDGIYVFLLQKYMKKLDKKVMQTYDKKIKLVSFVFTIPGKKPAKKLDGLNLYYYN